MELAAGEYDRNKRKLQLGKLPTTHESLRKSARSKPIRKTTEKSVDRQSHRTHSTRLKRTGRKRRGLRGRVSKPQKTTGRIGKRRKRAAKNFAPFQARGKKGPDEKDGLAERLRSKFT